MVDYRTSYRKTIVLTGVTGCVLGSLAICLLVWQSIAVPGYETRINLPSILVWVGAILFWVTSIGLLVIAIGGILVLCEDSKEVGRAKRLANTNVPAAKVSNAGGI